MLSFSRLFHQEIPDEYSIRLTEQDIENDKAEDVQMIRQCLKMRIRLRNAKKDY